MNIGKKDIFWNYSATFLKIASSAIILPFILKRMSSDTVGIWIIFSSVSSIILLFDFGFNASFTRNVSFVFSGVSELKQNGFIQNENGFIGDVSYDLLKGLVDLMKWFYSRIAFFLLALLLTVGTFYIYYVIKDYQGSKLDVYASWILLCFVSSYNLYTSYYESLLLGKGLVKKSKQIVTIAQIVYLILAVVSIYCDYGLFAIITSQFISVIITRIMSYRSFFTSDIVAKLNVEIGKSRNEMFKLISPNAIKLGLTALGGFMVTRSSIFIGSMFLPLSLIASYGVTIQIVNVLSVVSGIFMATYLPLFSQLRILGDVPKIRFLYIRGLLLSILIFIFGGVVLILFGQNLLDLISSKTDLLSSSLITLALIVSFLELNHSSAGTLLVTKNEVPFFIPSIISGILSVLFLIIMLYLKISVLSLIIAPGIAQLLYQNWKWPYEVFKDLKISFLDIKMGFVSLFRLFRHKLC